MATQPAPEGEDEQEKDGGQSRVERVEEPAHPASSASSENRYPTPQTVRR